ncbi:hypothetical protein BM1_00953 [Bipolaris maydis]|nr:hypothetical protein BM1_00953 [Bipolaris maydis]
MDVYSVYMDADGQTAWQHGDRRADGTTRAALDDAYYCFALGYDGGSGMRTWQRLVLLSSPSPKPWWC